MLLGNTLQKLVQRIIQVKRDLRISFNRSSCSEQNEYWIQMGLLNSDLLFCPVRSGKHPREEIHGWMEESLLVVSESRSQLRLREVGWPQSRRQREDVTALGMTSKVGPAWGHRRRLGSLSRSLQIPFSMTQRTLFKQLSASSLVSNLSLFHIIVPFAEGLQEVSHMTEAVGKLHF